MSTPLNPESDTRTLNMINAAAGAFARIEQTTTWAKATYERLPRELRDLVYRHLWSSDTTSTAEKKTSNDLLHSLLSSHFNATSSTRRCSAEDTRATFARPDIVGRDFSREAVEWYYEHGCLGREVELPDLEDFWFNDAFGVGVTPASCSMRSLNIKHYNHRYEIAPEEVELQFAPLLRVKRINGFHLDICIAVSRVWKDFTNLCSLEVLAQPLKSIINTLEAQCCKVAVQIEFESFPLIAGHRIEGQTAIDMLTATSSEWKAYMIELIGFDPSLIS